MTYSGVEVAYMDTSRIGMTERAMTEGELRAELVEQLRLMLGPMLEKQRTPNTAANAVDVYCDLVAGVVLAVLRPHLGLGEAVTVDRSLIDRLRHDLDAGNTRSALGHARYLVDEAARRDRQQTSAIAGRGEVKGQ